MGTLKAVIFDMDGVLVDSEPFHVEIEKRLFNKFQIPVSEEEHAGYMGTATDEMWKKINRNHGEDLDVDKMVRLNYLECNNYFSSLQSIEPMPGLVNLLDTLQCRNIPVAVASSSGLETIRIILEKSGIRKYFQQVVSSSMVKNSKPEPDIFLYAAKLLNTQSENCLVVEDSSNGIKAAKAAGMFCVAYTGTVSVLNKQPEADFIIDHFGELESFLV